MDVLKCNRRFIEPQPEAVGADVRLLVEKMTMILRSLIQRRFPSLEILPENTGQKLPDEKKDQTLAISTPTSARSGIPNWQYGISEDAAIRKSEPSDM
jgi:hypothetical protein